MASESWKTPLEEIADPFRLKKWAENASAAELPLDLLFEVNANSFVDAYAALMKSLSEISNFKSNVEAGVISARGQAAFLDASSNISVLNAAVDHCRKCNTIVKAQTKKEAWQKCAQHIGAWVNAFSSDIEHLQAAISVDCVLAGAKGRISVDEAEARIRRECDGLPQDVGEIVRWYLQTIRVKYKKDLELKAAQVVCSNCGKKYDQGGECPHCKRAAEEAERKRIEEEKRRKEEEKERERQRKIAEAEERKRKEEERRRLEEEAKRKAAAERKRAEEERRKAEQERKRQEEIERKRKIEEARRKKAEEAERKRKEEHAALGRRVAIKSNALSASGEGQKGKWGIVTLRWDVPSELLSAGQAVRLTLSREDGAIKDEDVTRRGGQFEDKNVEVGREYIYILRQAFDGQPNGESQVNVKVTEMRPPLPVTSLRAAKLANRTWRVLWDWPDGVEIAMVVMSRNESVSPAAVADTPLAQPIMRGADRQSVTDMPLPPDTKWIIVFSVKRVPGSLPLYSEPVSVPVTVVQHEILCEIIAHPGGIFRKRRPHDVLIHTKARRVPDMVLVDGGKKRPSRVSDGIVVDRIPAGDVPTDGIVRREAPLSTNPSNLRLFLSNPVVDANDFKIAPMKVKE